MSKDVSFSNTQIRKPLESNENETETEKLTQFPPPRTPLNTITDPLNKTECFDSQLRKALAGLVLPSNATPRVSGRGKSTHSEPNSANSTPARSFSRVRLPHQSGSRGVGGNSRVSRGLTIECSENSVEIANFELEDDPSFWKDHNVQVLIRVRPLSNTEMVSQGCGRCLKQESAQTLTWLGHPETRFTFDHVACEMISQEKLFKVVGLPMVDNCMSGYNSCIFAYGQTGSGKTYTMMGEICQMDGMFDEDCGITPRIFEYLFTKIREDEEERQDERLSYICKCSFLEIYNEQITDLLEPSSTNLQLREDLKKGVYVDDLTEHRVRNVNDVLKLLLQGSANRKMAATHMNSESSRSHSVFTCTIESRWEKDSMTHFRFGRLNLVDLAGSERQKSSGAEGDRLKEAANINKSLSTLGLVIMSLVDVAHGKHRHVPYRDSRLTFLLQDSLGGNSKTTIIANISPSICSANETLSTLKFAQRAKLIQNNAKINEDASGNVTAMQRQIQQLQGQLSFLMTHYNISRPSPSSVPSLQQSSVGESLDEYDSSEEEFSSSDNTLRVERRKIKSLEATLAISLNREKSAQAAIKRLEAQIKRMNSTAQQQEDDAQCAQTMLKSAEENIKRFESVDDGFVSAEKYLMEENRSLKEQNQLLQEMIGTKPEQNQLLQEMIGTKPERFEEVLKEDESQKAARVSVVEDPERLKQLDTYSSVENKGISTVVLQAKLDWLTKELEKAQSKNSQYQDDHELQLSRSQDIQLVCEQVEKETAQTILHLQGEVIALQSDLNQKLTFMVEENKKLRDTVTAKDDELRTLSKEWERATLELTSFLVEGSKYLNKASGQVGKIVGSFPSTDLLIGEHVEMAAKICIGKEKTISLLHKSLEEAQDMVLEMEQKLDSLKAAHVFAEVQLQGNRRISKETTQGDSSEVFVKNNFEECESTLKQAILSESASQHIHEMEIQGNDLISQEIKDEVEMARQYLEKSVFTKLDEALATTEEADKMLNALVEANENAQEMASWWKEACEKLMIEKASFTTEIEELKSLICSKDANIEMLEDHINDCSKEVATSISLLEQSFLDLKRDVDEILKVMHCNALTMSQDILKRICDCQLSFKAMYRIIMEKGCGLPAPNPSRVGVVLGDSHDGTQNRCLVVINSLGIKNMVDCVNSKEEKNQSKVFKSLDEVETAVISDNLMDENLSLKRELEQKENLLQGLLFDFSLLQESASTNKDMKDETDKLMVAFNQVQQQLQMKADELNNLLVQHSELEYRLAETENALVMSISDFELVKGTVDLLSDKNDKLRTLLKDLHIRKSEVEEQLEEERELIKSLEKEILRINSSPEKKLSLSIEDIESNCRRVTIERDQLLEQVASLQDRLTLAYSLVDENEAIAVEARQESEASKIYAEQKEEEVTILEHSVEELECTINVLEKKVYEMEDEVGNQKLIRDSLELELQALKQRILSVESFTEDRCSEFSDADQQFGDQMSRQLHKGSLELHEAHSRIRHLEKAREEQAKEIKQLKDYSSELLLHAEAQASQYQQKYKTLEEMVHEVSRDSSTLTSVPLTEDKHEKAVLRPRGSSSPFKCISSLVQQVNSEKDRELSVAKFHIAELEELAANRQKEVCMLNARLATTESMTHDVIRDLLGVKLDMTSFANLIDQCHLQKLVENAQLQVEESAAMEQEILNLRRQIDELVEERERYLSEVNRIKAAMLSAEVTVEQLQERDQLLTTQNEMLKADNSNLKRRVVDLDEVVTKSYATRSATIQTEHQVKLKENKFPKQQGDTDLSRRLEKSDKLLRRVNNESAQYSKYESRNGHEKEEGAHFLQRRTRNLR